MKPLALAAIATPFAALGYAWLETGWIETTRTTITVPRLPKAFVGTTVAFLTDIHHGPFTKLGFVRRIVDKTLALSPDLIVLGGDFVCGRTGQDYFAPCFGELARLAAPLGVFTVPGNHDYWEQIARYRAAVARTGIVDLTNDGTWLTRGNDRLRLAGVDDLWCGKPNVVQALGDCQPEDASLLLCHNPDFVESLTDPRVGLVLSGHTHGGQVMIPGRTSHVPSRYGTKYLQGLIQGPVARVYVSRGLGVVTVPLRFRARPEIALITLA